MKRKKDIAPIIEWFQKNMPNPESELHYKDTFSLLVAVMLSAQCTDKRVNMVTPALMERFPTAAAMAKATAEEIFPYIQSVTYPNNKSKHLAGMAVMVQEVYGGNVPTTAEELQKLPGVGRKTAHVIASVAFDAPLIAIDTHVFRISRRLGLSDGTTPLAVEKDLNDHFPPELRAKAHHWLILHGRYVCTARKPKCDKCGLAPYCDTYNKENKL